MDLPEDDGLVCHSILYFEKTLGLPQFSVPPLSATVHPDDLLAGDNPTCSCNGWLNLHSNYIR